jgi:hypothetical protein
VVLKKNPINREKLQKTLDKGRTHVLDYLTLIQDLVHFLEAIHNIWMSVGTIFYFPGRWNGQWCELKSPERTALPVNGKGGSEW